MKNRGITLIALVVTIIVLIILAGVSINLVLGQNGIITRAKQGGKDYKVASIKERVEQDILSFATDKLLEGEKLTVKEALIGLEEKGSLEEIDLEGETGISEGYIIELGYDEHENVIILEIKKDTGNRIIAEVSPKGYTKDPVTVTITVKTNGVAVSSIEVAEGMVKQADGTYKISQNGSYLVKANLEQGETIQKRVTIKTIDTLPPEAFEIKARLKEGKLEIEAETQDTESDESACSGIERYEYYVNDVKYDTQPIEGLEGDSYSVYVVAYDKAGNHISSSVKQVGATILYDGSNKLPTAVWEFVDATYLPWNTKSGTFGISTMRNGIIDGVTLSDLGTATTIQSYDLSSYESLIIRISNYKIRRKNSIGNYK